MNIESEIYQILERIVNKNAIIQTGDYSQEEKDIAMRIANYSLTLPDEFLSETAINKALIQAYRDKRKPE